MAVRQAVEKAVIRDEQNPIKEVLKNLHTTLRGLDAEAVSVSRTKYGTNKVTREKRSRCPNAWQVLLSIRLPPSCFVWHWYLRSQI